MSSTPKLIYFDLYGRGELARLLFAAAGAKFDDCRVGAVGFAGPDAKGNQETVKWPEYKSHTPYGQLPVLEVDGVTIAQSGAIQRYVATRYGLMGLSPAEHALVDATLEQLRDLSDGFGKIQSQPKDEQAAARSKYVGDLATSAASLEAQLKNNHGGKGWLVGNNISAADVALYRSFGMMYRGADAAAFDKSCPPLLKDLLARVEAHPNLAAYIKARPARPF